MTVAATSLAMVDARVDLFVPTAATQRHQQRWLAARQSLTDSGDDVLSCEADLQ